VLVAGDVLVRAPEAGEPGGGHRLPPGLSHRGPTSREQLPGGHRTRFVD
jgi:hypothetical protein